jgi:DNA-binding NarL/FixJ family response regulator
MSLFRVLAVDDFEPWRRFITSELKSNPRLQIVGQSSDGADAVRKAQELQPDLILLDIGLPKLDGIQAAKQIREVAPKSKIIFFTQEQSADVAAAALRTGANGYVVKSDAEKELLFAVEAVVQGKRFVSARLAHHDFPDTMDVRSSARPATDAD